MICKFIIPNLTMSIKGKNPIRCGITQRSEDVLWYAYHLDGEKIRRCTNGNATAWHAIYNAAYLWRWDGKPVWTIDDDEGEGVKSWCSRVAHRSHKKHAVLLDVFFTRPVVKT